MRLVLSISVVVVLLAACGVDESASRNTSQEYATGQLPTADSVQRDSDDRVDDRVATGDEQNEDEERAQRP